MLIVYRYLGLEGLDEYQEVALRKSIVQFKKREESLKEAFLFKPILLVPNLIIYH